MAVWHTFLSFKAGQKTFIISSGLSHLNQKVQIKKKSALGCHTRLDGQHCPLRTYHNVFLRLEKPSEDKNSRLFFMNKKGLTTSIHVCGLSFGLFTTQNRGFNCAVYPPIC
jgi:hypothetical protein